MVCGGCMSLGGVSASWLGGEAMEGFFPQIGKILVLGLVILIYQRGTCCLRMILQS